MYRSDNRGDTWTPISADLSRNLNRDDIPIMGRVWPTDAVSRNQATTPLSNIVSLDESPLLEGLIYAGTDDGLLQVTEDGGGNWRKSSRVTAGCTMRWNGFRSISGRRSSCARWMD